MNREIRFRAWDGKEMRLSPVSSEGLHHLATWFDAHSTAWFDGKQKDHPVMQYTGLKDKNGVEIYEGDVIKWGDHCDICHENPVRIAQVKFAPDIQFHSQVGVFEFGRFAYQDTDKHIEVIGNIYENPELLEEQS